MKAVSSQADINRVAWRVSKMIPQNTVHAWAASHQDDMKAWHELSLEVIVNTECDILAKEAI